MSLFKACGQLMFDAQLLGSFSRPYLDANISVKGAKIADIALGNVHLNVIQKPHVYRDIHPVFRRSSDGKHYEQPHGGVFLSIDIQVPAIKQSLPLRIELNGDIKSPMVIAWIIISQFSVIPCQT